LRKASTFFTFRNFLGIFYYVNILNGTESNVKQWGTDRVVEKYGRKQIT
jgi:hypothetical protein